MKNPPEIDEYIPREDRSRQLIHECFSEAFKEYLNNEERKSDSWRDMNFTKLVSIFEEERTELINAVLEFIINYNYESKQNISSEIDDCMVCLAMLKAKFKLMES